MTTPCGTVAPGFEVVAEAFAENFRVRREIGASCCAYLEGRRVVDIWAGTSRPDDGRPWEADTPVLVFSATKGATALCVLLLVQAGLLDLDRPVADYWPAFAAGGKETVTLRWVLSHRAGIPAVDGPVTLEDIVGWDGVVQAVADQEPEWPPGTAHGYHARSFGWILGEITRRVSARSLGRFFAAEVAAPLDLDFWIGLPQAVDSRIATIVPPALPSRPQGEPTRHPEDPSSLLARVTLGPSGLFDYDDRWNTEPYLRSELPSSNGVATARAVARMYAATIGEIEGIRLLSPDTVEAARRCESRGLDRVLGVETAFGLGFGLPSWLNARCPVGSFGHPGAGGSLGFADPDRGVAFGYVMNRMAVPRGGQDERAANLVQALYSCIGRAT